MRLTEEARGGELGCTGACRAQQAPAAETAGASLGFRELARDRARRKPPRKEPYERTRSMSGPSGTSDRAAAIMGADEVGRFMRKDMADGNVRQSWESSS